MLMTEYIEKVDKNGRKHFKVKFHAQVQRFKRVETLKYNGMFFNVYVDKNNNVHNLERTEVTSWKEVTKGTRKVRVPETIVATPQPAIMNVVRGNTYEVASPRIIAELDKIYNS